MKTNEPVAWMELYCGEPNNLSWTNDELRDSGEVYKTIPLYTHPAGLTDEEIGDIYWSLDSTGYDGCFSFVEFARAILRKAQEK